MIFKLTFLFVLSISTIHTMATKGKKPDCAKLTCGAICQGSCGWSSLKNKCMYGYKTSKFELSKGPGCKNLTKSNDDSEDGSQDDSEDGSEDESQDSFTTSTLTSKTHTITTLSSTTLSNTETETDTDTSITRTSTSSSNTNTYINSKVTETSTHMTDTETLMTDTSVTKDFTASNLETESTQTSKTTSVSTMTQSKLNDILNLTILPIETSSVENQAKTTTFENTIQLEELTILTTEETKTKEPQTTSNQKSTILVTEKPTSILQDNIEKEENETEENIIFDAKTDTVKSSQKNSQLEIFIPVSLLVVLVIGGLLFSTKKRKTESTGESTDDSNFNIQEKYEPPAENQYLEPTISSDSQKNELSNNLYAEVEDSNMYTLASLENGNVEYEYGNLNSYPTFDSTYQETNLGSQVVDYALGNNEITGITYDLAGNLDTNQDDEIYQNNRYDLAD